jgi:hypothetical protein
VKYRGLPRSAVAHERAAALFNPVGPGPTHLVLEAVELPIGEAPKLAAEVVAAGGWARCVRAHAEDLETCELVESVSVRVRLLGIGGYAMWINGRAAGASIITPVRKRLSHQAFMVALGLAEPVVVEYGICSRWIPWLQPCGATAQINKDGSLRVHKTPWGVKCR